MALAPDCDTEPACGVHVPPPMSVMLVIVGAVAVELSQATTTTSNVLAGKLLTLLVNVKVVLAVLLLLKP